MHQEDIFWNTKIYKQLLTELKGETNKNTIIVGNLNNPLAAMNRSSKQKIKDKVLALNDTLHPMGIINIYRALHPKTLDYTFFFSAHGTLSKLDHMLGH